MFEHEICFFFFFFFAPVFCSEVPVSISMELWVAFFYTNEKAEV